MSVKQDIQGRIFERQISRGAELTIVNSSLMNMIVEQSSVSRNGYHSLDHWVRVMANGRKLTKQTGANLKVVELFAIFHDSRRFNEGYDPEHGLRGAQFAYEMKGQWFEVSDLEMDLLYYACENHSDGLTEADTTVQTCWDADRLDLGRVGTTPRAEFLCTDAGKNPELIEWAHNRATKLR
jgi:uncharacterized protein